jgi:YfiR/HmsC-like
LQICVHGDFSFGTGLAELTRASTLNGHRVEVKWARKEQGLPECQILFVSHSAANRYDKTLDAFKNSITLTIGEHADFLEASGMVTLQSAGVGVSFDVNLDPVNDAHLKLSSQMLSLARRVIQHTESAKN